jgi:hypothetical protein
MYALLACYALDCSSHMIRKGAGNLTLSADQILLLTSCLLLQSQLTSCFRASLVGCWMSRSNGKLASLNENCVLIICMWLAILYAIPLSLSHTLSRSSLACSKLPTIELSQHTWWQVRKCQRWHRHDGEVNKVQNFTVEEDKQLCRSWQLSSSRGKQCSSSSHSKKWHAGFRIWLGTNSCNNPRCRGASPG